MVFFDDILVFSRSFALHVQHLRQVLALLRRDQWYVKKSKCVFAQQEIKYLGHTISAKGVSTDSDKIQQVSAWPVPTSVKEVRAFLGLAGYYRRFVRQFGMLARPLTHLLRKNTPFQWTEATQSAFDALKTSLTTAPTLALPDFTKPFMIETDACEYGVGAVLQQDGHPIAYLSKALGPRTKGLSTYEKEYLAIVLAVEQWRPYLQFSEFVVKTDQRSLVHLEEQRLHTPWQQKAFTKLLGLQYRICYRKGTENSAAHALSRQPVEDSAHLHAISVCQPAWLQEIVKGYDHDPKTQQLITQLAVAPVDDGKFTLTKGVVRFKGRVWLGNNTKLQQQIMRALHDSSVGGHSGFPATYRRIKHLFAWPGMKQQIKEHVQTCQVCQQAKPDRAQYPGLLHPLPVAKRC